MPPHEAVLPRGVMEEDILPKRYETFTSDHDWVQRVRCSLLGLEAGTTPSRKDIDTSSCFVPQVVVSKSDPPEVITDHWLPILRREGLLVEGPLNQFTATVDWVPLYTPKGLQKYLPVVLSSFTSQGTPSLTAIVPPEFHVAELHSQQRPLTRGREPWRLHMQFWNTFTPSISRPCMKWET